MESEFVRFESIFSKLEISCSNKPISKEIILVSLMKRGLKLKCSNNYGIFQIFVKPKPAGLLHLLLVYSILLLVYSILPLVHSIFPLVCPPSHWSVHIMAQVPGAGDDWEVSVFTLNFLLQLFNPSNLPGLQLRFW